MAITFDDLYWGVFSGLDLNCILDSIFLSENPNFASKIFILLQYDLYSWDSISDFRMIVTSPNQSLERTLGLAHSIMRGTYTRRSVQGR